MYYNTKLFGTRQYTLTGQIFTNIEANVTYGRLNSSIWAIIYYINKVTKDNKELISTAIDFKLPANEVFEKDEVVVIPASKSKFKLTPDILCQIEITTQNRESSRGGNNSQIDIITLSFTLSTTKQFNTILMFINTIVQEYTKMVDCKNKAKLLIYKPTFRDIAGGEDMYCPIRTVDFKTNKTFDNLFFDGKDELIERLNSFVKRNKYDVLGLPETLGLLFYGEPGTGKTSCIKAIANYLDKHIIIVPMNQIKTKKRLEELFFSKSYYCIPSDKRIYVFEEIDCNGWENIVKDRAFIKDIEPEHKENNIEKIGGGSQDTELDKDTKYKDNDDKLTLGAILEAIDGLIECPGRVIIMTTNHKEYLDSALLRPGRIDIQIHFKRLRHCHIVEIFKKWYGTTICYDDIRKIPDYKYTQAEISQLLFKYENDSNGFLSEIIKI